VSPRAGLDAGARRKILCPCRGPNPDRPARIQTLYCLSYRYEFKSQIILVIDKLNEHLQTNANKAYLQEAGDIRTNVIM
jgi:hypothetical protein